VWQIVVEKCFQKKIWIAGQKVYCRNSSTDAAAAYYYLITQHQPLMIAATIRVTDWRGSMFSVLD
jgi:hypothetical protein